MKNSRSRLVIRNAISELIEQLTRHAAPCLVGPSASFTRAVFVGYWVHLRAGKSQLLFFCSNFVTTLINWEQNFV